MTGLSSSQLVALERETLCTTLSVAGPSAPTLCEGWETRHLVAHLLLRESSPLAAAGVVGGPLAARTERLTRQLADDLLEPNRYEQALNDFRALPGPLGLRRRAPGADAAMNIIEYFVHIEDVRRALPGWGPRSLETELSQRIWSDLLGRARLMAGQRFPGGLVLEAPGYSPIVRTVITPPVGSVAQVLTGDPGELVLYLFGRERASQAKLMG